MAIVGTAVASGTDGNTGAATSYSSASLSPAANQLILAWVWSVRAAGLPNTPSVSGCGLTWVQVATVTHPLNDRRMTLFRAMGPAPTSGAVTFDFGGQTQDHANWSVCQFSGVQLSGTNGADAIVQSATGTSSSSAALSCTLLTLANSANASAGAAATGSTTVTAGSGYTELGNTGAQANQVIESEYTQPGATLVNWTFGAALNPVGIAVELAAAGRAPAVLRARWPVPPARRPRGAGWRVNRSGIEQTIGIGTPPTTQQQALKGSRKPIPRQHRAAQWWPNLTGTTQASQQQPPPITQQVVDGSRKPIPRQHRPARWFANPSGIQLLQGTTTPPTMLRPAIWWSRWPIPRQHRPARWFANPSAPIYLQPPVRAPIQWSRWPIPKQHRPAAWWPNDSGVDEYESLAPPPAIYTSAKKWARRQPMPRQHRGARWLTNKSGVEQTQSLFPPPQVYRQPQRYSRWPIPHQHRGAQWWPNRSGTTTAGFIRPAQLGSHCRPILEVAFASSVADEPPVWTDVSRRVRQQGVHPRRGRTQELQQFSAGKLNATLDDRDRALDPLNTLSPYYPNVDITKPVRLRGEYPWLPGLVPNPNFDGIDGSGSLAGWSLVGAGTMALDPTNHYLGNNSVQLTSSANQVEFGVRSDPIPVAGGMNAVASFRGMPAAGTKTIKAKFEWFYDLAGTLPISTDVSPFAAAAAGDWTRAATSAALYVPNSALSVRVSVLQDTVSNGDIINFDTVVFDYGTFQGIFPVWYGYLDKLTPRVEGLDRVVELEATDAFSLFTLSTLTATGYADLVKAGVTWDIFGNTKPPTNYWRLGDKSPVFTFQDEYNVASLTIAGSADGGAVGALPADTDTAASFKANPGGFAFSIGALFTHVASGLFECWLKWTDTGQSLMPYVGIASQTLIVPLPGWASSPLLISMAGDGAIDTNGAAVARGSLCIFTYSHGAAEHYFEAWGKSISARIPGDGKWHHVMVKLNAQVLDAYIDGVSAISGSAAYILNPTGVDFGAAGSIAQSFVLSPDNYYGVIHNGTTLWDRIQGWDGDIDEVAIYDYAAGPLGIGPDALAHYKAGAGQWANQTPGVRMNSVLDTIAWPSARRNIGIDSAPQLQPVDASLTQTNALSYMQTLESNDLGYLLMGADGKVTFLTRQQLIGAPLGQVKMVFGNEPVLNSPEVPYELAEPVLDQMILYNQAEVQQQGGPTYVLKDAASISKYWTRTVQAQGMLMANVTDAAYMAQWLILHYKNPETRVDPIVLNPLNDDRVWQAVLQRDVGDLVELRDRMRVLSGYRSYIMRVQGVSHDITADKWECKLAVASADAQRFFTLDDPSLGMLSSGNRLGW